MTDKATMEAYGDMAKEMIRLKDVVLVAAVRAERQRCATVALDAVKPILPGAYGMVHVAEIGRTIAAAILQEPTVDIRTSADVGRVGHEKQGTSYDPHAAKHELVGRDKKS